MVLNLGKTILCTSIFLFFAQTTEGAQLRILTTNGLPVPYAEVLIGHELDNPFENNFLVADADGTVEIPSEWTGKLPVTIESLSTLRATYLNRTPVDQELFVQKDPGYDYQVVKGNTVGYGDIKKDEYLDFALVSRMIAREEFVYFSLNDLISPYLDEIKIFTVSAALPSNLAIPKQKVKWSIFTLGVEKPLYRSPTKTGGEQRYFAARGHFDFKKVNDQTSDRSFAELLNEFSFFSGGITVVGPQNRNNEIDIDISEIPFDSTLTLSGPTIANDEFLVGVLLNEDNGRFFPSDAKSFESGKDLKLVSSSSFDQSLILVAGRYIDLNGKTVPDRSLSVSFIENASTPNYDLLDLIERPQLIGSEIVARRPSNGRVQSMGTYATYEDVKVVTSNGTEVEEITRLWEIFSDQWEESIVIPSWPGGLASQYQTRWTMTYMGNTGNRRVDMSPFNFSAVTHLTRSETELQ